ncbi:MAG TPA: serine/threonine-protein kinase [Phycisphaerae bacterium]|nr:serine/threonine-protein kinase [Phycisphaerae bacterium]
MSIVRTLEVPGYQVLQFLGSGAKSTIWQVKDHQTGKFCALKRVVKREQDDTRFLEQALNEFQAASQFDHPVVRKIYRMQRLRHWLSVREIHLFMEWCEGHSVQENRPGDVQAVVRIFRQVADALAHMNSRGYIHADTKPNNIIVCPRGGVKIIDLGQSCPIGTVKERIQGTPDFIAPEQVHRGPLDSRTDAFNFGATLYWTLTGRPIPTVLPRDRPSNLKSDFTPTPVEKLNENVPASLSKLIGECVEMKPSRRPESMSEVASRLGLIAHSLDYRRNNGNHSP